MFTCNCIILTYKNRGDRKMKKIYVNPDFKHFLHGGDYNPDQWQNYPEVLEEDMRLMRLANCNSMSVGIFAWAALEPEEGKYDFSFLDKAMDDIYANGGRVILATPSGARPAWMAQKYPEVLRVDETRSFNFRRPTFRPNGFPTNIFGFPLRQHPKEATTI